MGEAKQVTLDGQQVQVLDGETQAQFLQRSGLANRTLILPSPNGDKLVRNLDEVPAGAAVESLAQSELG